MTEEELPAAPSINEPAPSTSSTSSVNTLSPIPSITSVTTPVVAGTSIEPPASICNSVFPSEVSESETQLAQKNVLTSSASSKITADVVASCICKAPSPL